MTMAGAGGSQEHGAAGAEVVAYPPAWRAGAAVLKVVARGSLLVTAGYFLWSDNPPTNPLRQMRLFGGLFVAPELAAWCIARAFAAKVRVADGALVLEQRERRTEIPVGAITAVDPWLVPLPRGGLRLRLKSGRHFTQGLAVTDPVALVDALVAEGASPDLRAGLDRRIVDYARARLTCPAGWLENPVLKFVVYSLVPTLPAFRLHQFITYGGTFGEYYTFGLEAYLLGLGLWWASWSLGLVILAAVVRAVVEVVALAAAFAIPSYAVGVRRGLEIAQRVFYYVGIPAWLFLRFTS